MPSLKPSLKSQMLNFAVRNRHLMRFKLRREKWDANTSIASFRQMCEEGAKRMGGLPGGITLEPVEIAGIKAEWIRPAGAREGEMILFTHGGGYISGSCADHRGHVAKVAAGSGLSALLFEYRLAPEHPFPAGLEDTLAVYRALLAQGFAPERMVLAGDSAGGGLALALLLALREQGLPLPAGAAAVSPWTDLKLTGESHRTRRKVCVSPEGMNEVCAKHYCGEHDPGDPLISPLYGDLRGLPPLLILVGDHETLRDDSTRFAEKARAAGVDVTLRVEPGQTHCYPFYAPLFPEAVAGMAELCAWIRGLL